MNLSRGILECLAIAPQFHFAYYTYWWGLSLLKKKYNWRDILTQHLFYFLKYKKQISYTSFDSYQMNVHKYIFFFFSIKTSICSCNLEHHSLFFRQTDSAEDT